MDTLTRLFGPDDGRGVGTVKNTWKPCTHPRWWRHDVVGLSYWKCGMCGAEWSEPPPKEL